MPNHQPSFGGPMDPIDPIKCHIAAGLIRFLVNNSKNYIRSAALKASQKYPDCFWG